jgi:hypothetical protein
MSDTTAAVFAVLATIAFTLVLIAAVWPLLGPLMSGIRRYRKTGELRYWHEWAVVEDAWMPPYDIDTLHSFRWSARWAAAGNPNLSVMTVAEAITKDRSRFAHRIVNLPDTDIAPKQS